MFGWKKVIALALLAPAAALAQPAKPRSGAAGAERSAKAAPAAQTEAAADQESDAKGRLPRYFGKVVDEQQKSKIYEIQASYAERLKSLNDEVKKLTEQRDDEIKNVLTPEQQKQVDQLAEEAKARRPAKTNKSRRAAASKGQ